MKCANKVVNILVWSFELEVASKEAFRGYTRHSQVLERSRSLLEFKICLSINVSCLHIALIAIGVI
jgi:hypothetical protein